VTLSNIVQTCPSLFSCLKSSPAQNNPAHRGIRIVYIHPYPGERRTYAGTYSGIRCSWRQVTLNRWMAGGIAMLRTQSFPDHRIKFVEDSDWDWFERFEIAPLCWCGALRRVVAEFLHHNLSESTKPNTIKVDALRLQTCSTRMGGSPTLQMLPASDPSWGSLTFYIKLESAKCDDPHFLLLQEKECYLSPNVSHKSTWARERIGMTLMNCRSCCKQFPFLRKCSGIWQWENEGVRKVLKRLKAKKYLKMVKWDAGLSYSLCL
jgi:hypothetical protein